MNEQVYVLIEEHDNGTEVIGVYRERKHAEQDLEMYELGSEEAGNVVEYYIEAHTMRNQ